jgi:hypothetical protein
MRAAGVLAALALALPASAAAVPTVTSVVAKTGDAGVTFLTDPSGAGLTTTQKQYVVSNGGYAVGFAETNGVSGGGVLDYSALPSDYRAPMTAEDKRAYPAAQTDVQAHATCSGVPALSSGANILAWQAAAGRDPTYDYVPWQKTTAGLGDDPRAWLPVVKTATGVDLSTLTSVADFTTACTRLGGTYHAADTQSAIAGTLVSSAVAAAVAPLNTQIASLRRARDASDRAAATARDAQKLAETAYQALFQKPIDLTLAAKRFTPDAGVAMITGSPTDPVDVTLEVTRRQRKSLGLSSRILAEAQGTLNADGAVLLTLKPDSADVDKLERRSGTIAVTVLAVSGGNQDSARAKLVVRGLTKPKPKPKPKKAKAKARAGR